MRELTLKEGKIDYSTGNPLSKRKVRTRISAVYLYQIPPPSLSYQQTPTLYLRLFYPLGKNHQHTNLMVNKVSLSTEPDYLIRSLCRNLYIQRSMNNQRNVCLF